MTAMGNFFETKPTLSGEAQANPGALSATISGLTFQGAKGFIFAVAQRAEEMSDTLTSIEIRNLTKFNSSSWMPITTTSFAVSVLFRNLTANTDYKAAILATSDDPRLGAASSSIIYLTFKTSTGAWSSILSMVWTSLIMAALLLLS